MAWAFNGIGLALIIPNSQSLVADYYTATRRGEAFGTLMLTGGPAGEGARESGQGVRASATRALPLIKGAAGAR